MTNTSIMPLDGSHITTRDIPIDAARPLLLSITNSSGDVSITAADRPDVRVVAERRDHDSTDGEARIEIDVDGNRIAIHPNWQISSTLGEIARKVKHQLKEGFNSEEWDLKNMRFGMNARFDVRVEVPRHLAEGSSVAIKTASGDISVADLDARISSATGNGDIRLDRLTGKVSAHSARGDIALSTITGTIEANAVSGDISVSGGDAWTALRAVNGDINTNGLVLKNARFTTVSGDIRARVTMDNTASYTFDTVSGDIELQTTLPASGASLNYKAVSGDSRVGGDWTKGPGKRTWQLPGGSEGPDIRVKAVSGDLQATAIADPTLTVLRETPPQDQEPEEGDTESGAGEATSGAEFDWAATRNWFTSMARKMSQVINDIDASGSRQEPPAPPAPPAAELPAPPTPPEAEVPAPERTETAPVPPPPSAMETEPFPADAPAAADSAPETPSQRRLRLLEAVQRGEMTVDEALAQMDGDGGETLA